MTRDEAIKTWNDNLPYTTEGIISVFEKLGMLKLDEPMSAEEKFKEAIYPLRPEHRDVCNLLHVVEKAGLRIIEK